MSKIPQNKIPIADFKVNWKLVRESDGLTKASEDIGWIEFDDTGRAKKIHKYPAVGYSLIMSPFNWFFTWQTTVLTEILYMAEDGSMRFKTENSVYTLTKIEDESNT
jgi:hypothetical protein